MTLEIKFVNRAKKLKHLPNRASNPRKKARHKECWERGQARKAARREVEARNREAKLAK